MVQEGVVWNCTSVLGVAVWSYWLKFLIISRKLHLDLYVIWTS